jgi:hypothetical protein
MYTNATTLQMIQLLLVVVDVQSFRHSRRYRIHPLDYTAALLMATMPLEEVVCSAQHMYQSILVAMSTFVKIEGVLL